MMKTIAVKFILNFGVSMIIAGLFFGWDRETLVLVGIKIFLVMDFALPVAIMIYNIPSALIMSSLRDEL